VEHFANDLILFVKHLLHLKMGDTTWKMVFDFDH